MHGEEHVIGWESFGKTALRPEDWKIVQTPQMDLWSQHKPLEEDYAWQLFNLADDPIEIHDLAADNSDKLSELIVLWGRYERDYAVIVPNEVAGY